MANNYRYGLCGEMLLDDESVYMRNGSLIAGLGIGCMYAATGDDRHRDRALVISRASTDVEGFRLI